MVISPRSRYSFKRLETAVRERWGEEWAIRATHFADRTTQAYAFHSCGVDDGREKKTLEQERLYVGSKKTVFRHVCLYHEDIVGVLEERELDSEHD